MRKILIVEDEKMIRYGIYVMIENSGVPYQEIRECRNGREAISCLTDQRYDLVLTDIRMPFVDGMELSKWIYESMEPQDRPFIVAISGYAEFEYARKMLKLQAVDYLLKPVDRRELGRVLWRVEELLREKGRESAEEGMDVGKTILTGRSRHKMQKAVDYIRQNYGSPIDMAEVSNHVSMNYSAFSQIFKEYTGENFSNYLKKLRIEKGKKLLCNPELNIHEISRDVGVEDARRFAKMFKEETGLTPTAWREQQKNDTKNKK